MDEKNAKEFLRVITGYLNFWESWVDENNNPKWINPVVEKLTGYSIDECLKMKNYPLPLIYEEDLKKVEEGIKTCLKELGGYKELLDNFFKDRDGYNEEMISKEFKISEEKVKELLRWYARLELGIKIRYCIKKQGDCNFTAEC